jgi:hypothetical protein
MSRVVFVPLGKKVYIGSTMDGTESSFSLPRIMNCFRMNQTKRELERECASCDSLYYSGSYRKNSFRFQMQKSPLLLSLLP